MNGKIEKFGDLPMRVALATFMPPSAERLRFIKQLGVDDVIIWGTTFGAASQSSEYELNTQNLLELRTRIEDAGLRLFAVETLPAHWYNEIVLGSEGGDQQIRHFQNSIRAAARAGIPVLGYCWNVHGVWRTALAELRGGARGTAFDLAVADTQWTHGREYKDEELWKNYEHFLKAVLPVAEAEGVLLALHPNDPPIASRGGVSFLFRNRLNFQRAMDMLPSPNHGLTLCLGCWSEMGDNAIDVIRDFGKQGKIFYAHFQAVRGAVPNFHETFVDEGDYGGDDAWQVLCALDEVGFRGVMIPGHVPQMEGDEEWRTSASLEHTPFKHSMGGFRARAYTIGYLKGMLRGLRSRA